jgi:hypothetical protein
VQTVACLRLTDPPVAFTPCCYAAGEPVAALTPDDCGQQFLALLDRSWPQYRDQGWIVTAPRLSPEDVPCIALYDPQGRDYCTMSALHAWTTGEHLPICDYVAGRFEAESPQAEAAFDIIRANDGGMITDAQHAIRQRLVAIFGLEAA